VYQQHYKRSLFQSSQCQ